MAPKVPHVWDSETVCAWVVYSCGRYYIKGNDGAKPINVKLPHDLSLHAATIEKQLDGLPHGEIVDALACIARHSALGCFHLNHILCFTLIVADTKVIFLPTWLLACVVLDVLADANANEIATLPDEAGQASASGSRRGAEKVPKSRVALRRSFRIAVVKRARS